MNIIDKDWKSPVYFSFKMFKQKKKYSIIFFDFLNPEEKVVSMPKKGWKNYSILEWTCLSENDYDEEGIPKNNHFTQNIPESSFGIAIGHYRYRDRKTWKYLADNKDKKFTVRMTFERETMKSLKIDKIEILDVQNEEPEDIYG